MRDFELQTRLRFQVSQAYIRAAARADPQSPDGVLIGRCCTWMSSYALVLAGNDAWAFVFVCRGSAAAAAAAHTVASFLTRLQSESQPQCERAQSERRGGCEEPGTLESH